jgi:SPP1 family predicted phage head-tail adaptor
MKAGDLNRRVTLQSPSGISDALGERTTVWTDQTSVWASINPLTVREILAAGELHSETSHRVRIRYSLLASTITSAWRIMYGTRIFVLQGAPRNVGEANDMLELLCSEGLRTE